MTYPAQKTGVFAKILLGAGGIRRLGQPATILWANAGAPTSGGAGTYFNKAEKGDLLVDTTNAALYQNSGTKASPTWTVFTTASGSGAFTGTFNGAIGGNNPAAVIATTIAGTTIAGTAITGSTSVSSPLIVSTGVMTRSVATTLTASITQTRAGGLALTKDINNITTCAHSGDAVTLPALTAGQSVIVRNAGANPASVFPNGASDAIDGGSGGASVTLTNGKAAMFICLATNVIVSHQLGAVSA